MRDPVSSQYSSFLFWRMPIPELDLSELEDLGLSDTPTYKSKDSNVGKWAVKQPEQSRRTLKVTLSLNIAPSTSGELPLPAFTLSTWTCSKAKTSLSHPIPSLPSLLSPFLSKPFPF